VNAFPVQDVDRTREKLEVKNAMRGGIQMEQNAIHDPPNRVTDLLALKKKGLAVTCGTSFEILPVDFFSKKWLRSKHRMLDVIGVVTPACWFKQGSPPKKLE